MILILKEKAFIFRHGQNIMKKEILTGTISSLRSLEEGDLDNIFQWLSDKDVTKLLFYQYYPPKIQKMKEEIGKEVENKSDFEFAIIDKKTKLHVGWAGIYEVDRINKNGEIRFFIGDKKFWGKGLATECVTLLIDYAFRKLNLHRLYGGANIENTSSLKIFEKLGFSEEGISKEGFFKDGKYYDLVKFGLINKV